MRATTWRLFLTCWIVFGLHFATNTVREIYPALALGDHLSFDVSEYAGLHPDIFTLPGRGTFINNNPGASVLGAVPYALTRPGIDFLTARVQAERERTGARAPDYRSGYALSQEFHREAFERGFDVKFGLGAGVMQALLMAPVSAAAAVVMFAVLRRLTRSERAALWLALLYAFATPVFYRTAQLNQNLLVAHAALFAFVLLWQPAGTAEPAAGLRALAAGLLAGWAVVLDYSGVIVLGGLSIYAAVRWIAAPARPRTVAPLLWYGAGVVTALAVLAGYQWTAFGHPLYPAQHYMPAANFTDRGYRGFAWPQLDLLWETAFSIRFGLFVSAPLLLLALWPGAWRRGTRLLARREAVFVAAFAVAFLLFCAANQYGRMQFNSGVRHIVPVTPFVFLVAAGPLVRMPRGAALLAGGFAAYWSWCLAMYRDVEQGAGVLESIRHVTVGGPRLPWLTTLHAMGYVPDIRALYLFLAAGALVAAVWLVPVPGRPAWPGTIRKGVPT